MYRRNFRNHAVRGQYERERTSTREARQKEQGLELAIVKKLVDLKHGDVINPSNSGQGTKIQISLLPFGLQKPKNRTSIRLKPKEYK